MKTKKQAQTLLEKINKSELTGLKVNLHELEKKAIPEWKRMLQKYIMKGVVPEGGHNPVRLWIVEAPFSPLSVFEKHYAPTDNPGGNMASSEAFPKLSAPKGRKYAIGDRVGACSDCMAEFVITGLEKGGYKAKCVQVHISDPKDSILKVGQEYFLKEKQIVVKL